MNTITMICWKRPDYLRQAIASVQANDKTGFDAIHIFAEPDCGKEMYQLLYSYHRQQPPAGHLPVHIHYNVTRLGTDRNGFTALSFVFDERHSDFNVHVEEDVILSSDALSLALRCQPMLEEKECMCMCLHNHHMQAPSAHQPEHLGTALACQRICEFNPYGWGCTAAQWKFLQEEWFTNRWSPDGRSCYGWDWSLNYHCAKSREKHTLMPMISRATTIGELGGVHMSPEQWRREFADQAIAP